MKQLSLVSTKVLVLNEDGKVLLLKRSETDERRPLEWDLPGGWVETNEAYEAAASRELNEETGLLVEPQDLRLAYTVSAVTDHGNSAWMFYACDLANISPVLSSEHVEFKWTPIDEAVEAIAYPRQHDALEYIAKNKVLEQ